MNLLALTVAVISAAQAQPLLVTTDWLAQHLNDRGLVIFHIGDQASRSTYDEGHIPGAQFLAPLSEFGAPRVEGALSLELPSPERLDSVLEAKGISDDTRIVLYAARGYYSPTSRALLTLEYAGMAGRVSILDGGLEIWKREGRPLTAEAPVVSVGRFTRTPNATIVTTADFVKAHLEDPAVRVIDARDTLFYQGRSQNQNSNGHIPGAGSIPFGSIIDSTGKYLPPAALRAAFAQAGVKDGQTVVTYCHIGQQATVVWFAARVLGFAAKLYDGSFQDWSRQALPIANPAAKP
ncbi:MAG: sulfurtransferase [Gemmatimonadales bacterium]|nr:sulfurtransferase [Gemmatimonadales bacterium]